MTLIDPLTPQLPIGPYMPPWEPLNNVTPLTYRDGTTYLRQLELLAKFVNETLVIFINQNFTELGEEFQTQVNALIQSVNAHIDEQTAVVNAQLAAQDEAATEQLNTQNTNIATSIANLTTFVNDSIASIINSTIAVSDPVILGVLNDTNSNSRKLVESTILASHKARTPIYANDYGAVQNLATLNAALDAAEARGKHTVVHLSGFWDVGNGLNMNGRSAVLLGDGAGGTEATPWGTVLYASTQTGPVINWSGWVPPTPGFGARVHHGGFIVQGDNQPDPTLAKAGMKFGTMNGAVFTDIAIRHTGGPCVDMSSVPGNGVYLCDFERFALYTPVGMKANNVPFFRSYEANGNRFRGFSLRALHDVCGASGAVQILSNPQYAGHDNLFDAWVYEALTVPQDGTLFHHVGNTNMIHDFQFFDCGKEAGATGTSYWRLAAPVASNTGGNEISGAIMGRDTTAVSIDTGVDVQQWNNRVVGVKSYKGYNVTIQPGIGGTYVELGGQVATANNPAVIDNSGLTFNTNTVRDSTMRLFPEGGTGIRRIISGRFYGATNHALSTGPMRQNVLMAIPFWLPVAATFTEIDVEVTTAGAAGTSIRLGIYTDVEVAARPNTVVLEAGSVDATTTGVKSLPIVGNITLQAGLYWLAAVVQGGTCSVRTLVGSLDPVRSASFGYTTDPTTAVNCHTLNVVSGALPAWGGGIQVESGAPKIALKAL